MGWLFIVGLGIIWAAFLLPFGARRAAPASTVEEFERKMDLLAETNKSSTGRWVLVPRKGERFMGARDRKRLRVRRRRKAVFSFLLEATVVTLLIGLFPPLRAMLLGAAILAVLLFAYVGLLIRIRGQERHRARMERIRRSREPATFARVPVDYLRRATAVPANGNGNGHAHASSNGNGNGNGHGFEYVRVGSNGNGHAYASGNGHAYANGNGSANGYGYGNGHGHAGYDAEEDPLSGPGVVIVEDDVHVIIRRSSDLDAEARAAAR